MEFQRNKRPIENQLRVPMIFIFFSLCVFLSATRIISTVSPDCRRQLSDQAGHMNPQVEARIRWCDEMNGNTLRRGLGGPGSSPPRCNSKCGKCSPCKPVHVPVPPVTAEYYPEAWRCKCGNKLYMP